VTARVLYRIELTRRAERDFLALPEVEQRRLARRIDALAGNPYPPGSRKLAGAKNLFRIRSGDYRVIYEVRRSVLLVLVIRVGHRREIYR
jgi:mRNA interferase RelE/StbE